MSDSQQEVSSMETSESNAKQTLSGTDEGTLQHVPSRSPEIFSNSDPGTQDSSGTSLALWEPPVPDAIASLVDNGATFLRSDSSLNI